MSNKEGYFMAQKSLDLANKIKPLLAGHSPKVQGAALAELLATWLAGHRLTCGDASETERMHEELLAMHIVTVRILVRVHNS